MTGSIKDYTPNFNLIIPEFNITGWHDYLEEDFRSIDAMFYNLFGINNYKGQWKNSTVYNVDDVVFIGDDTDYSGRLVKVLVQHTTAGTGNFTEFFTANPSYYELFADASSAQIFAQEAKDWAVKMDGPVEDDLYSSKFYANIVNDLSTEITTLYNIRSDIRNVSMIGTEIVNVSNIKNSVQSVANNSTNINTVANNTANISNVSDNINAINTANSNITNINSVANDITNINTVANNTADIITTATNILNVNTNATNISAINTNASNISDIQNASSNAQSALNSKNLAQEWAISENLVDNTDYSAKHYAEVASQHENPLRIGQIVESTIPLNDAGLHLLDGSLIQGNGIYSEFVDFMVQNSKKFNPAPFSFSGGASVNSNGITSYLNYDNRCTVSVNNVTPTNNIIFNFSGILKSSAIRYADMWGGFEISRSGPFNPTLRIKYRYTTYLTITEDEISTYNDNFTDIKIELTSTKIKVTIKNNSNTFTKEADISISFGTITGIGFPGGDSGSFVANLKNCSLIVDNTEIFSGYTQQDYFTDETSWQNSVNTYGVCGKFVYDKVNNTIRLPKVSGFIEGTIDPTVLGDLTEAGLPNITATGQIGTRYDQGTPTISGAFVNLRTGGRGSDEPNTTGWLYDLDASKSNAIYGNSSTVQPQSIKVLYYIVIATSTKTDIEVDIDEIATDLNGKADIDLSNINTAGKSFASGLAMPSSRYIDLTLGASGTTYTAPANGYFCFNGKDSSNTGSAEIVLRNQTRYFGVAGTKNSTLSPAWAGYILPAKKGDTVGLFYLGTLALNNTNWSWRFYYAEGEA